MSPPAVLTIAGSDSSGGAGIQVYYIVASIALSDWPQLQADLKTFAAHECYGTSVITALTAQNTIAVQGVHPAPPAFVAQQVSRQLFSTDLFSLEEPHRYAPLRAI